MSHSYFNYNQKWQRFCDSLLTSQELKTVSYHKLYDILKQHQNEVNEIRAERLARTANPLALVHVSRECTEIKTIKEIQLKAQEKDDYNLNTREARDISQLNEHKQAIGKKNSPVT
ncbi:hypothetical protein Tco_1503859 [Tanacetum coccineum]